MFTGDGFIDRGEYVTIQTLFGNNEADSNKAFDKLTEVSQSSHTISQSVSQSINQWGNLRISNNEDDSNKVFDKLSEVS